MDFWVTYLLQDTTAETQWYAYCMNITQGIEKNAISAFLQNY